VLVDLCGRDALVPEPQSDRGKVDAVGLLRPVTIPVTGRLVEPVAGSPTSRYVEKAGRPSDATHASGGVEEVVLGVGHLVLDDEAAVPDTPQPLT
jgi:hypothetical protein